ncbi:MAG: hypothetical protein FWH55_12175, partial [Oscillospiraceae bacterium]|nr:hypothetical protein [Oscillospiraceae bacterium]
PHEPVASGAICGFLWADGDGSLPTDWDGMYNGDERPLAGYPVYLFAADNLAEPLSATKTGIGGTYVFDNLYPGAYIVGLFSSGVNGKEYILPLVITGDNKFEINWDSEPLMAHSEILALEEGQTAENIDAGMRLPLGYAPMALDGGISGFIWADGDGTLPTDWDGLYNGDEAPISGYTVLLYAAGDLTTVITSTQTRIDGTYIFEGLEPGSYVVGLTADIVNGQEYLLPLEVTTENKFTVDWDIYPLTAYSYVIELTDGQTVGDVNAGMRLLSEVSPSANKTLAALGNPNATVNVNDIVRADNYNWYVVKIADVPNKNGGPDMRCFMLACTVLRNFNNGVTSSFGSSINYEGSLLQNRMETRHLRDSPTLKAIAVKADLDLGNPYPLSAVTTPIGEMAGDQTKDIMFAMSYRDAVDWNGGKNSPLINQILSYGSNSTIRFWLRTERTSAELYGVFPYANTIDAGLHHNAQVVGEVPTVWVYGNAVNRTVKVYYIDKATGDSISTPDEFPMIVGNAFTYEGSVPEFSNYEYVEWKKGLTGQPQGISKKPELTSADVIAGTDLYIVYEKTVVNVTIAKTVDGEDADKSNEFKFSMEIKSEDGAIPPNKTFSVEGGVIDGLGADPPNYTSLNLESSLLTFRLKHGQTLTIKSIPSSAKINVVEEPHDRYSVEITDSSGDPVIDGNETDTLPVGTADRRFDFLNERKTITPTGINIDSSIEILLLFLIIPPALWLTAAGCIEFRRRKKCKR